MQLKYSRDETSAALWTCLGPCYFEEDHRQSEAGNGRCWVECQRLEGQYSQVASVLRLLLPRGYRALSAVPGRGGALHGPCQVLLLWPRGWRETTSVWVLHRRSQAPALSAFCPEQIRLSWSGLTCKAGTSDLSPVFSVWVFLADSVCVFLDWTLRTKMSAICLWPYCWCSEIVQTIALPQKGIGCRLIWGGCSKGWKYSSHLPLLSIYLYSITELLSDSCLLLLYAQ